MSVASLRLVASGALARVSDRAIATLFIATGGVLVYLALFDQGAAVTLFASQNLLHEFFHDGRHFWNAPCH